MSTEPRYERLDAPIAVETICLDCGTAVTDRAVHTRFHAILSVHDKYDVKDRFDARRNTNNWSAEAFEEVVGAVRQLSDDDLAEMVAKPAIGGRWLEAVRECVECRYDLHVALERGDDWRDRFDRDTDALKAAAAMRDALMDQFSHHTFAGATIDAIRAFEDAYAKTRAAVSRLPEGES